VARDRRALLLWPATVALVAGGSIVATAQAAVCAEGRCPLVVARIITFRDPSHLTMTWTHRASDVLRSRIWPGAS
jgi:hypothetical protein